MDFFMIMATLIDKPWVALIFAMTFFILYATTQKRFVLIVGFFWLAYCIYEYGIKFRVLCSGECNIRIELLLVYPLLVLLSLVGLVVFTVSVFRKGKL